MESNAVKVSARIARHSRKGGTNQEEHPEVVCSFLLACICNVRSNTFREPRWEESGGWMDESAYPCMDEREVTWMDGGRKEEEKRCVGESTGSGRVVEK